MYKKYRTEVLVLGSREYGEADRVFALYTRDFGLARARASAVRDERSRMRYALQNYSRAHASLVRGKRGWRVAGAEAAGAVGARGAPAFARVSRLLLRLVAGEEPNAYLFNALAEAHGALATAGREAAMIEVVCVARMLYALGYLSNEALKSALFAHTSYAAAHLVEAEALRDKLLVSINEAISETQL